MKPTFTFRSVGGAIAALAMLAAVQVAEAGLFRAARAPQEELPAATSMSQAFRANSLFAVSQQQPMAPPVAVASPCEPAPCCPQPCISYRHIGRPVACCGCAPPTQTMLSVKNPCTCNCCNVNIPVCLPACCQGEPTVSCRHGLFACGVVTYDWCCGVSVVIKFKACGDVIVTYHRA